MEMSILNEYDKLLIGKEDVSLEMYLFEPEQNQKIALELMKYAFTYYLNWTPKDIYSNLTYEIIKDMRLEKMLNYIEFPIELDKKKDLYYIAVLLYPRQFKVDKIKLAINYYKDILNGKHSKFPKEYLTGQIGYIRAYACMQYLITHHLLFNNMDELYKHFASSAGIKTLKEYKLASACSDLFQSPLDYLHYSLPENDRNYFLYNYYKFDTSQKKYLRKKTLCKGDN